MIKEKDIKKIRKETINAQTEDEWKAAVVRLYNLYGRDAIYYLNCGIFAVADDKSVKAIPYINPRFSFGVAIRHIKNVSEDSEDFAEDENILFA